MFPGVSRISGTCWIRPLQVRKPKWLTSCTCYSPMLFSYIINKPVFPIVGCPLCTKTWMEKTQWWGVLSAVHWNQFYRKSHFTQSELMCIGLLEKAAKRSVRNNHQDWEGLSCWFSGVWGVTRTCVRMAPWSRVILRVFSIKWFPSHVLFAFTLSLEAGEFHMCPGNAWLNPGVE